MAFHARIAVADDLHAVAMDSVHLFVVIGRIVMVEIKHLDVGVDSEIHRIDIAGVPPTALFIIIVRGVLRIVNQDVRPSYLAEFGVAFFVLYLLEKLALLIVEFIAPPLYRRFQKIDFVV